jgi:hypothetical protein
LILSANTAQALSFDPLLNYDDASFNAQKTSSSTTVAGTGPLFEEKWVAEARSGDRNGTTTSQAEVSINQWFSNPSGSVVQTPANRNLGGSPQVNWINGIAAPFIVDYKQNLNGGTLEFKVLGTSTITPFGLTPSTDATTTFTNLSNNSTANGSPSQPTNRPRGAGLPIDSLWIRLASPNASTNITLSALTVTDSLTTLAYAPLFQSGTTGPSSTVSYLALSGITGDFTLKGNLTWNFSSVAGSTGQIPGGNSTGLTVKGFTTGYASVPVPGPLPIMGALAAFGWSRKLRKRIIH